MEEMLSFDKPTRVIVHFTQDENISLMTGQRIVRYQVIMGDNLMSPSGAFIRFNHDSENEIHGWVAVEDIKIDEVLEEIQVKDKAA